MRLKWGGGHRRVWEGKERDNVGNLRIDDKDNIKIYDNME
jgi:hypothetical protein